jgi:hypothetical protein
MTQIRSWDPRKATADRPAERLSRALDAGQKWYGVQPGV